MGLFSTSSSSTARISEDGTSEAPNRSERARCWEARDSYFRCLDRSGVVDSLADHGLAAGRCPTETVAFEKNCASSWIQYFKKRRVMEHKRNETLEKLKAEGAQPFAGAPPS